MKGIIVGILMFLLLSCNTQDKVENKNIKKENDSKTLEALLIGTFHFANFNPDRNSDIAQINTVDVFSKQNQNELEYIANKIASFNPSKIFVEYPFVKQAKLDSSYTNFFPDNFLNKKRNEIVQLAFRTAKKLNHKKVFAFDYTDASFPYDEMIASMKNASQNEQLLKNELEGEIYEEKYNKIVKNTQSVTELLFFLNEQKNRDEDAGWYLNTANAAGTLNDTIGTFLASEWYRRNLMMYSIVQKTITKDDERIMILSGASHTALFKSFIDYNTDWKAVELNEVLNGL